MLVEGGFETLGVAEPTGQVDGVVELSWRPGPVSGGWRRRRRKPVSRGGGPGDDAGGVTVDMPAGMMFGQMGPFTKPLQVLLGSQPCIDSGLDVVEMSDPGRTHR